MKKIGIRFADNDFYNTLHGFFRTLADSVLWNHYLMDNLTYETLKEKLLRLGGYYFDPDADRSDLYYGHTEYGWEEVKEVTPEEIKVLQDCGILEDGSA